jgi:hypothetical protein
MHVAQRAGGMFAIGTMMLSLPTWARDTVSTEEVVTPRSLTRADPEAGKASTPAERAPEGIRALGIAPGSLEDETRDGDGERARERRARVLLTRWLGRIEKEERKHKRRSPLPTRDSLAARAARQAAREYQQYQRLMASLERSQIQSSGAVFSALAAAEGGAPLPDDPCGRVERIARDIGIVLRPATEKTRKQGSLASQLGLDREASGRQACNALADELTDVAKSLQAAFGALSSWPPFAQRWLAPVLRRSKRAAAGGAAPSTRSARRDESGSARAGDLSFPTVAPSDDPSESSTFGIGDKPDQPPLTPGRAKARMRYSGH